MVLYYILLYTIILYLILYYTLLFSPFPSSDLFFLSFPIYLSPLPLIPISHSSHSSSLLFLPHLPLLFSSSLPSPSILSSSPLPPPIFSSIIPIFLSSFSSSHLSSHSFYTCRYLLMFIYILSSIPPPIPIYLLFRSIIPSQSSSNI